MNKKLLTLYLALMSVLLAPSAFAEDVSTITIDNSGSTNASGYKIIVVSTGVAHYDNGHDKNELKLSKQFTDQFFFDVHAAVPLERLAAAHCAKSTSFGTITTVVFDNERSPDISCPGDPKSAAIYQDVRTIEKAMGVTYSPRIRPIAPIQNTPQSD